MDASILGRLDLTIRQRSVHFEYWGLSSSIPMDRSVSSMTAHLDLNSWTRNIRDSHHFRPHNHWLTCTIYEKEKNKVHFWILLFQGFGVFLLGIYRVSRSGDVINLIIHPERKKVFSNNRLTVTIRAGTNQLFQIFVNSFCVNIHVFCLSWISWRFAW